ncbi:hypothetical protein ILUMI_06238 [Ignelater luminosus]|uniref:Transposase n=1 Tax=Ignelater luminosus TaxID=2038154 RepID=A0A8K0D5T5_IGNLU|nr:hypothetical protein ILUMI_06238 [Ignelater luminosus]
MDAKRNIIKAFIENGYDRATILRTPKLIKKVRESLRRNCAGLCRKLAKTYGVSRRVMQRILKDDLRMTAYKKRKIHGITDAQRKKRYERIRELQRRYGLEDVKNIIFSDEKLFVLEDVFNPQNGRLYATKIENIPHNKKNVCRFQNKTTVMVCGAVSFNGVLPLVFVEKGVEINARYYMDEILQKHLIPGGNKLYPAKNWVFQQDSAPAHAAKIVRE